MLRLLTRLTVSEALLPTIRELKTTSWSSSDPRAIPVTTRALASSTVQQASQCGFNQSIGCHLHNEGRLQRISNTLFYLCWMCRKVTNYWFQHTLQSLALNVQSYRLLFIHFVMYSSHLFNCLPLACPFLPRPPQYKLLSVTSDAQHVTAHIKLLVNADCVHIKLLVNVDCVHIQ